MKINSPPYGEKVNRHLKEITYKQKQSNITVNLVQLLFSFSIGILLSGYRFAWVT